MMHRNESPVKSSVLEPVVFHGAPSFRKRYFENCRLENSCFENVHFETGRIVTDEYPNP